MLPFLALVLAWATVPDDSPKTLQKFLWEKRPLLLFAPSSQNSDYQKQITLLQKAKSSLEERDVILLTCTDPVKHPKLRALFRVLDERFSVVLIGKDGGEKWRSQETFDPQDLIRRIDAMPMGREEALVRQRATAP